MGSHKKRNRKQQKQIQENTIKDKMHKNNTNKKHTKTNNKKHTKRTRQLWKPWGGGRTITYKERTTPKKTNKHTQT